MVVNTLAADEKYPVLNKDSLAIPIQMQLSQKQKTFVQSLGAFLEFNRNFKYFSSNDDPHRFCISEIADFKNVVR